MELPNVSFVKSLPFLASNTGKSNFKVLFISHTANLAGAERSLIDLIINLKKKGVICKVIIPHHGLMEEKLKKLRISYELIPYKWFVNSSEEPLNLRPEINQINSQAIVDIISQIKKFDPDIVYTNTMVVPWGAIAARLAGKPHIWSIREFGNTDHNFKFDLGYKQTLKMIDNLSSVVFVNSKAVYKEICKVIPKSKVSLFYNYITLDHDLIGVDPKSISGKFIKDPNIFKLIIAGSILPGKGQFEAVKALKYLKDYPVQLTIVGSVIDKNYHDKITKFINTNKLENMVNIIDFTENPYKLIKQSDCLLNCSKNEAFGRTTVEGMLLKKVVIGSRSGGTKELIIDNQTGLLYTPGKPALLAAKIAYLINNPKLAKKIARSGYQSVKRNFTEQNCIEAQLAKMQILANNKSIQKTYSLFPS